jgi:acyl carrier protein
LVEVLEDELAERSCAVLFDDEDLVDLLTVRDAVDYVMARMGS